MKLKFIELAIKLYQKLFGNKINCHIFYDPLNASVQITFGIREGMFN